GPPPAGAATGSPPSRAAGAPSSAGAARWGRPALAVVLGVAALLPLVPRWPYPPGPDVTPPFFTTPAVQRLPPGTVVVTLPYPARNQNEALVWQAKAAMRFRLVGGTAFFVPGPDHRSLYSGARSLRPPGIYQVFNTALNPAPGTAGNPPLPRQLGAPVRQRPRRPHGAAHTTPRAPHPPPAAGTGSGPPPPPRRGAPPGPGRAARSTPAPPGPPPQSVGGVLAWFHV